MPSELSYRRAAVPLMGRLGGPFTATSTASSASELVCTRMKNTELRSSKTAFGFAYIPSTSANVTLQSAVAGEQVPILENGFNGTDGKISTARAFSATPVSGLVFELHEQLPAIKEFDLDGWRECINRALESLTIPDRIDISAVSGTYSYEITAFPWLTDIGRIVGLDEDPFVGSDRPAYPTLRPWEIRYDAEKTYLENQSLYSTGDPLHLKVRRPANTRIKRSGAWADVTDGLQADTEEAVPPVNVVKVLAVREAYRVLWIRSAKGEGSVYEAKFQEWSEAAEKVKITYERPTVNSVVLRPNIRGRELTRPPSWYR